MDKKDKVIRNHKLTMGRWSNSNELQDLTKNESSSEDRVIPDEDPPEEGFDDGDGKTFPVALCLDCIHCYDNRSLFQIWKGKLLRRPIPVRSLFCEVYPREAVINPVNGELTFLNEIWNTASKGMKEPDERCEDMNPQGNCESFTAFED